jgi:ABC-type spermidine/putrescine transport system permease subunit II
MRGAWGWNVLLWAYIVVVLLFLSLPLVPPFVFSLSPSGESASHAPTLRWYGELWRNPLLVASVKTSALLALLTGALTPSLALFAAMAVRELRISRIILLLLLLPLFIPGVSMGLPRHSSSAR